MEEVMGHYAASARPAHSNSLQIVPLKGIDTGLYAASQRAAHQILDNPKIFEDLLALRIIGGEAESKLRRSPEQFQDPVERTVRALMVVRSRYAEDELARSIQRGIRQYIILGAGLDTFAYRNSFPLLQVFEVDHPATQAWKRSCLERAAIPIPASVTFVSVDFERQMMMDALGQSGFKSNELTFISWFGVVRYLSPEAFISVLTSIVSSMRPGSEVVFDFGSAPTLLQRLRGIPHRPIWAFKKNAWLTYHDPASIKSDLKRIGFADVQLFGPTELNDQYCNGRTDGLRFPINFYLVKARVPFPLRRDDT
jgi:methyltransferase (TIGR00027 family)